MQIRGFNFLRRKCIFFISDKHVVRGMHFQRPPHAHDKIVTCTRGSVLDVLLDLRGNEPTFGQAWSINLSAGNRKVLFIPAGIAHGFLALEANTLMLYQCSTEQFPESEGGIAWDSFGFDWGT